MSVKDYIGCCGFYYCQKCAYYTGEIVELAREMLTYIQKYRSLEILSREYTEFHYGEFKESVVWLTEAEPCNGCRYDKGWSWLDRCPIRKCITEREITFCFECEKYPCDIIEKNFMKEHILRANKYLESHEPQESDYDLMLKRI
jgi:hypothetical protein